MQINEADKSQLTTVLYILEASIFKFGDIHHNHTDKTLYFFSVKHTMYSETIMYSKRLIFNEFDSKTHVLKSNHLSKINQL